MSGRYTLYGADFSLYSGKARCYLEKKGIPFDEILATIRVYKKFIVPRTGVSFIPVVQTPDDQVFQDTTVIINELEQHFPEPAVFPDTPKQKLVALLLEVYCDEWLVIPAMHYRWAYQEINQPYIFEKFGSLLAPRMPRFVRARLGKKLGDQFKKSVPLLGVTAHNQAAIELSYENFLADLERHFERYDYLLGDRPCIADFGLIGPFFAHLYQDPYPGQYMRANAPAVSLWVERMTDKKLAKGEFLADDEIPETLLPILQRMAREQLPVLLDTDNKLSEWREQNPDMTIPRSIGTHEFSIEGVTEKRMIIPYVLWMFKRPVDFFNSLVPDDRKEAIELMRLAGFDEALQMGLRNRLIRRDNTLQFASPS